MKINILYLLIPAALLGCYYIVNSLQDQSIQTFFGTAETEPRNLNFDHDVMVQSVKVQIGGIVKKGDTLAVLYRAELDKTSMERLADMNQIEVENRAKQDVLSKEKDLLLVKNNAKISDLQAQIKLLHTEDSIKQSVKNTIYANVSSDNRLIREKIAALSDEIAHAEKQTREQLAQLEIQGKSQHVISQAKLSQIQKDLDYVSVEKSKLYLIAPIDGFVEQVNICNNMLVRAFQDLIKINPRNTNKIVGFIHESSEIPFHLGDSVALESSTRMFIKAKGSIIGSSPKLVELPYRLRKFTELRAWGREVYIEIPDTNQFYIGEKVMINLQAHPLSKTAIFNQ